MRAPSAPRRLATAALLVCGVLAVAPLDASERGRSGFSGNPESNGGSLCSVCHAPGADTPTLTLQGPTTVQAGSTASFSVLLTGGPGVDAGIDVSVSGNVGLLAPVDGDLQLIGSELSHVLPKPMAGSAASFGFNWTAPAYDTSVTIYVAGNSADGRRDLLGDAVAATAHVVEVVGGTEPPPDPPEPPEASVVLDVVASGFASPVAVATSGAGASDPRLFVVERRGTIAVLDGDGTRRPQPLLDIQGPVDDGGGEMGLLGLAFHPQHASNGHFYVYYTWDPGPGADRSRISRFTVGADPNRADPATEVVLMEFEQPFSNHNGGDLHFGPDGYLYIASGDGGSGGDPLDLGQDTASPLGKLLRIDVDVPAGVGDGADCSLPTPGVYAIPTDNAYGDGPGGAGCDEIFALGLRNPWRFSFDPQTGALWIGDVGQGAREEVNRVEAGAGGGINFGWRCFEGTRPFNLAGCDGDYFPPVYEYSHAGGNCSITGGVVYRGARYPELSGRYFFSDFCVSSVRALSGPPGDLDAQVLVPANVVSSISSFGVDAEGEVLLLSLSGTLYRVRAQNLPPVLLDPGPQEATEGQVFSLALLASDANGDTLRYVADGLPSGLGVDADTGRIDGIPAVGSAGSYGVTVGVEDGRGGSDSASFTLQVAGDPGVVVLEVGRTDGGAYGSGFGSDAHPTSLTARFDGIGDTLTLDVLGYDIDNGLELAVFLDDVLLGRLRRGPSDALNPGNRLYLPASPQGPGPRTLRFEQRTPGETWGVTGLRVDRLPDPDVALVPGVTDPGAYGNGFGSNVHPDGLAVHFPGGESTRELSLRGHDVGFTFKVLVFLNSRFLGVLSRGPRGALNGGDLFSISPARQLPGTNRLEIRPLFPGLSWGVTELLLQDAPGS